MSANADSPSIAVGCWVRINDHDFGEETIHLVEEGQQRPEEGRFPPTNPFAQALIGAKAGETVSYALPGGGEDQIEVIDFGSDA